MVSPTPTAYGLLGMLATRSWTGYELTVQVRRSLRFVWSTSEGHLYREQRRLVDLGWADVAEEPAGRRTRKRYAITEEGRRALAAWLATEPEEPHLQVEGLLRAFLASSGTPGDLAAALRSTAEAARAMLTESTGFAAEYLADGGPLAMLEGRAPTGEFHGRPMFPERLHSVALALDLVTRLLEVLAAGAAEAAEEAAGWVTTTDGGLTPATRRRLEAVRARRPGP